MRSQRNIVWTIFILPLFLTTSAFAYFIDDTIPEVTARVSRISFVSGDVKIKRSDSQEWEKATQNLPIVEGDQIATDQNSRAEIQFDSNSFLRLAENSYFKVVTLRDEGIAVSLPQGTASLRALNFDKDRSYFEIDAPSSTISVLKSGLYRIDSGDSNNKNIRVSVTDNGQARVYSDNSGFVVKNGRSARLYLDGSNSGEWETSDASSYIDDFGNWVLDRDAKASKRLQTAAYDKYYDRDMYGAEELDEHGEWIYTKKYGYVWRPYNRSISSYSDWSPYRYGSWRWVSPYGWTWINDEPWGWATYHHGRWINDDGYWSWCPYGSIRSRRSWWQPALVIISWGGPSVYWYPLPWSYGYNDYNRYCRGRGRGGNNTIINNTTIINNNTTIINPRGTRNDQMPGDGRGHIKLPPGSVVTMPSDEFGKGTRGIKRPPLGIATEVINRGPKLDETARNLPTNTDRKPDREILSKPPIFVRNETANDTGVMTRKPGVKLDENLQNEKIYDRRKPVDRQPPANDNGQSNDDRTRGTGAVKRPPMTENTGDTKPAYRPRPKDDYPTTQTGSENTERKPQVQPRSDEDRKPSRQPVEQQPREERKPRYDPPTQPTYEKPREQPRQEKPREQPRQEQPRQEQPRQQPQPRQDPPRQEKPREQPRQEDRKPSQPQPSPRKDDTKDTDN
jgi:hypothetical protein